MPARCTTSIDCSPGQVCSAGTCQTPLVDGGSGTGGGFFIFDGGMSGGSAGGGSASTGGGSAGGTGGGAPGTCNTQNCSTGCCDMNGVCQPGTTRPACGIGGALCVTCGPGRVCSSGVCSSPTGGGSAGGAAGGSAGGLPGCGPQTCSTGCCSNGLCVQGTTPQACGVGGIVCVGCTSADVCMNGACVANTAGGAAGGSTAGGAAGGSTAGGSTAGGSTAGGSTAGGSTAGGSTAGGSTAGGSTAGGSTAGGSTAGGSTAGGSTAGGSTAGGSAGGSTAGGSAGGTVLAGDTCGNALAVTGGTLTSPTVTTGTTVGGFTDNYGASGQTGCVSTTGIDRVYSVAVGANQRVFASVRQGTGAVNFDPSINLIVGPAAQCEATPRVCVAGDDIGAASAVNRVRYLNPTASAQTVFAVIDTVSGYNGPYQLDVSVDTPAAGDACEAPIALTSGTPRTGEALTGFANDYFNASQTTNAACSPSTSATGIDRAYSVLVGAGEQLTVTVTPSAGLDTAINLHGDAADCSVRACQTSSNTGGAGAADVLQWINTGAAARTMLLVVETTAGATGTFTISTETGTPPGDVCATTAPPISTPITLSGQSLVGYQVDYSSTVAANGCEESTGPDRVYAVTVPPRQRLVANVTAGTVDPVINIVSGTAAACNAMPRVCVGSADNGGLGTTETAVWDNGTTSAQNAFVIVSSFSPNSSAGTFSLGVDFRIGDSCLSPRVLSSSQTLTGENLTGLRRDFTPGSGCRTYSGAERVYQVTLQPGQDLTFAATSTTSGADVVINAWGNSTVCPTPTATMCFASADSTSSGTETIVATNPHATATSFYIAVSEYGGDPMTFNVTATIQ